MVDEFIDSKCEVYDWMTTYYRKITRKKGELYGVEVEFEGDLLPHNHFLGWRYSVDPSLKGRDNAEYVFTKPMNYKESLDSVDALYKYLDKNGAKYNDSVRAGVHVHVNVQDLKWKELFTFLMSYYLIENVLTKWCGKGRSGNHFCLRSKDAEYQQLMILKALKDNKFAELDTDDIRYTTVNLISLFKFGSLEFRALRTPKTPDRIKLWINILTNVKENSLKHYKDPRDVLEKLSFDGPDVLLKTLLGDMYKEVVTAESFDDVLDSIYYVQDLAYVVDWDNYKVDIKKKEEYAFWDKAVEADVVDFNIEEGVHPVDAWLARDGG